MALYSEIRQIYDEYLDYLQENPRIRLPEHIHDPELSIGKIHASSLGRCPKASALKRKTKIINDLSTKHLMQQGVRDAEPLQEAMFWKGHQVEVSVEKEIFRGRIDILYKHHVIEIKRRDGYMRSDPSPKLTDVYQLIAYQYITGLESIHLCLMTRFNLFFWQLVRDGNGFKMVDEQGREWKNSYNNSGYLNYSVLKFEGNRHLQYMNGERTDDPMPNFLNIPMGNECYHWEDQGKPKKYKTKEDQKIANICPHCPFFAECKGLVIPSDGLLPVEEIEYGSKEYRLRPI